MNSIVKYPSYINKDFVQELSNTINKFKLSDFECDKFIHREQDGYQIYVYCCDHHFFFNIECHCYVVSQSESMTRVLYNHTYNFDEKKFVKIDTKTSTDIIYGEYVDKRRKQVCCNGKWTQLRFYGCPASYYLCDKCKCGENYDEDSDIECDCEKSCKCGNEENHKSVDVWYDDDFGLNFQSNSPNPKKDLINYFEDILLSILEQHIEPIYDPNK